LLLLKLLQELGGVLDKMTSKDPFQPPPCCEAVMALQSNQAAKGGDNAEPSVCKIQKQRLRLGESRLGSFWSEFLMGMAFCTTL